MKRITLVIIAFISLNLWAENSSSEYLIKLNSEVNRSMALSQLHDLGLVPKELYFNNWLLIDLNKNDNLQNTLDALQNSHYISFIQPNYPIRYIKHPELSNKSHEIQNIRREEPLKMKDNPEIPDIYQQSAGEDPELVKQWGLQDIQVNKPWTQSTGDENVIVAVLDTGIDYRHEDLNNSIWRNLGELGTDNNNQDKATNGIDDDKNGYIDDVIGWDFYSKDNKPFDLTLPLWVVLFLGGNPGHGTHCAGTIAAQADNAKGISGIAPNVKILPLRFLGDDGSGTTADAILAIRYAVEQGVQVMSNSWGSEGEEEDEQENLAMKEILDYTLDNDVVMVFAAGNSAYDNDTHPKASFPASYDHPNIISVAALNAQNQLADFSNWGIATVDIAAPGVEIFSTVPLNIYTDKIGDEDFFVTWDGTSMAAPHVAGAVALYRSYFPKHNFEQAIQAIYSSSIHLDELDGKVSTSGKLNMATLLTP